MLEERSETIGRATNNVAEYRAAPAGHRAGPRPGRRRARAGRRLGADRQARSAANTGSRTPACASFTPQVEGGARGLRRWSIRHVRREENEHADRLVNEALDAKRLEEAEDGCSDGKRTMGGRTSGGPRDDGARERRLRGPVLLLLALRGGHRDEPRGADRRRSCRVLLNGPRPRARRGGPRGQSGRDECTRPPRADGQRADDHAGSSCQTEGEVPGLDDDEFQRHAEAAKEGCPVSRALAGVDISLDAKLADG